MCRESVDLVLSAVGFECTKPLNTLRASRTEAGGSADAYDEESGVEPSKSRVLRFGAATVDEAAEDANAVGRPADANAADSAAN